MDLSTRDRIIEHVAWQFLNNGIKNITMDEIAEQLGMSKRTIYEHFRDKKELVMESMNFFKRRKDAERKRIFQTAENSFAALLCFYKVNRESLFKVSHKFFDDIKKYFPEVNKSHEEAREMTISALTRIFAQAMEEGYVIDSLDPAILAYLFTDELNTVFDRSKKASFQFADLYDTVCLTFFRGISTEKGLGMIEKHL